jgi:hypothetical protein
LGRDLLRVPVSTQRFKRHRDLKLVQKTASLGHLCILSFLLDTATFGRTPDRQSQLRTSVEKHAVALTPELIKDFGLQPLIDESRHN